jgi:predicted Zn-ribbon and HTH transcriptional regulator
VRPVAELTCEKVLEEFESRSKRFINYIANLPLFDKLDKELYILQLCKSCLYYEYNRLPKAMMRTRCPRCGSRLVEASMKSRSEYLAVCEKFVSLCKTLVLELCRDLPPPPRRVERYRIVDCQRLEILFDDSSYLVAYVDESNLRVYLYLQDHGEVR